LGHGIEDREHHRAVQVLVVAALAQDADALQLALSFFPSAVVDGTR